MEKTQRAEIIKLYKQTIDKNVALIEPILRSFGQFNKENQKAHRAILSRSSDFIVEKWGRGAKHLRTMFALEAFGPVTTKNELLISVMIDSMINILDDLLDEELQKNDKVLYMFELVRIVALLNQEGLPPKFQREFSNYIHKLISLAVLEQLYLEKISQGIKTGNVEKTFTVAKNLLLSRSKDIDIFVTIPLISVFRKAPLKPRIMFYLKVILGRNPLECKDVEKIYQAANLFRAINIMKKDILDIDHDIKTAQITMVSYLYNERSINFVEYIHDLLEEFARVAKVYEKVGVTQDFLGHILRNFLKMAYTEIEEIKRNVLKLHDK